MNIERDARWALLAISGAILLVLAIPWRSVAEHESDRACENTGGSVAAENAKANGESAPPAQLGAISLDKTANRFVAPLGDGRATLTMIPALQAKLEQSMADYRVPWCATARS